MSRYRQQARRIAQERAVAYDSARGAGYTGIQDALDKGLIVATEDGKGWVPRVRGVQVILLDVGEGKFPAVKINT